jgi:hypothetical protein
MHGEKSLGELPSGYRVKHFLSASTPREFLFHYCVFQVQIKGCNPEPNSFSCSQGKPKKSKE